MIVECLTLPAKTGTLNRYTFLVVSGGMYDHCRKSFMAGRNTRTLRCSPDQPGSHNEEEHACTETGDEHSGYTVDQSKVFPADAGAHRANRSAEDDPPYHRTRKNSCNKGSCRINRNFMKYHTKSGQDCDKEDER